MYEKVLLVVHINTLPSGAPILHPKTGAVPPFVGEAVSTTVCPTQYVGLEGEAIKVTAEAGVEAITKPADAVAGDAHVELDVI